MKPKEILLADDDPSFCRLMTVHCQHLGLNVRTAHDAMHALTVIHKNQPDLILMDIQMPAGNGISACEMLFSDPRLSGIPVIIISGTACEKEIQRCHDLGARFVPKTVDLWPRLKPIICESLGITPGKPVARRA